MGEIEQLLQSAWASIKPKLLADPDELRRRLARRNRPLLQRPPRTRCLAIRASDTRINPARAPIIPEDAVNSRDREHPGRFLPHQFVLDNSLLHRLCGPVRIERPGGVN
jgi:hypothetical protein